ncbi:MULTISPECIES: poly(R)-hydroxyalkanoic acid synthase subunit [Halorussus]|uniref:poly(R)-hydroxyalkanoic acid synthase subunit n=1 Tax=Halorussus TaxID=1070314 RepID=UPI000E214575|nr:MULTISPECIES: poly(R)-hydroxyalkanoic acid synthase subunit [Halorussus]NHN57837.1 poly(R)-hydroxyalkanoic acid synthase subunit [Halorussus sp. JP-T4]
MSESSTATERPGEWPYDDAIFDALRESVEAQGEFVDRWAAAMRDASDEGHLWTDAAEGYARAYEVWMEASQRTFERSTDLMAGEEVSMEEFRDLWLDAANDAFKELASSDAFAAALAQNVEGLDVMQDAEDAAQTALHSYGFATEGDVVEVGERLVELERRQHEVERKLDRVLDAVEE